MTADHAERVAEIYSGHARGYADFWSPIIRPVACRLLDALPWTDAHRVLDIGTGTGPLFRTSIAARLPRSSSALIDPPEC